MMLARFHPELRNYHHFYFDDGPLSALKEPNNLDLEALGDLDTE